MPSRRLSGLHPGAARCGSRGLLGDADRAADRAAVLDRPTAAAGERVARHRVLSSLVAGHACPQSHDEEFSRVVAALRAPRGR
ncbi:hypothetical protein ACIA8I_33780 [Streptomyces rishiriensis]|uniref:hypothetical protein n=1 Tax=Streptomyces rishiriensis TaxID=68264 RepID=UPI0037A71EEC